MISVHSWNLFDDLRIVIDPAVQKNRRGQFQHARRNCASSAGGAKIALPEPCGSHVERSRGECIKQEITARSPKMRCSSTVIASVVYVSHFTPVVTKASYNIDALDDAWYHTPAAGGTRRLSAKGSPIEQDGT
jgi:hypothetical protein